MNRNFTSKVAFLMDNYLPAFVRDSRILMYPLFYIWFRGKDVKRLMEFKSYFHLLNNDEFAEIYTKYHQNVKKRSSDLHDNTVELILQRIGVDKDQRILDVGCGSGFVLEKLYKLGYKNLYGCDIVEGIQLKGAKYCVSNIESLCFTDGQFDTVICSNTLEHVLNPAKAASELKRVASKQLIVTVPCQKYFRYTFDLHINFFPQESFLEHLMDMENHKCVKISGDLFYVGISQMSK